MQYFFYITFYILFVTLYEYYISHEVILWRLRIQNRNFVSSKRVSHGENNRAEVSQCRLRLRTIAVSYHVSCIVETKMTFIQNTRYFESIDVFLNR